ncbi:hypothetical protein ASG14_12440 [Pedobacter sp. Leaf194]|nr:hypothetical protein ASG14_12440 [Pedobacter sp. Leaf194]
MSKKLRKKWLNSWSSRSNRILALKVDFINKRYVPVVKNEIIQIISLPSCQLGVFAAEADREYLRGVYLTHIKA